MNLVPTDVLSLCSFVLGMLKDAIILSLGLC